MSKSKCLIIGYGVVGHNLAEEIKKLQPDIVDKYKDGVPKKSEGYYDIGFICVNTPLMDNGFLDCSEVRNTIYENDCDLYVIKSTVPVGTTSFLARESQKRIVFSPEYYGATQHCNNFDFPFTILGGQKQDCIAVQQILQEVYDARHKFHITTPETAEMAKFMENSWLATKVTFCCEFFRAAEKAGVNYEELRELFLADPRVNPAHTFVYREHPYYDSHCLNKDVPQIANQFDIDLLKQIQRINKNSH